MSGKVWVWAWSIGGTIILIEIAYLCYLDWYNII